jgi:hypothetical protein
MDLNTSYQPTPISEIKSIQIQSWRVIAPKSKTFRNGSKVSRDRTIASAPNRIHLIARFSRCRKACKEVNLRDLFVRMSPIFENMREPKTRDLISSSLRPTLNEIRNRMRIARKTEAPCVIDKINSDREKILL